LKSLALQFNLLINIIINAVEWKWPMTDN